MNLIFATCNDWRGHIFFLILGLFVGVLLRTMLGLLKDAMK